MAYFNDLTIYNYTENTNYPAVNIGWLEDGHEFNKGEVPKRFVLLLWEYIKVPINRMRGVHQNITLDGGHKIFVAQNQGYSITLGSAEIRVMDADSNIVYAAPNLILNYILNHQYLPPKSFIDAVIDGPKPNSDSYRKLLIKKDSKHYNPTVKCIFCGSHKLELGYHYINQHNQTKEIEIVEYQNLKDASVSPEVYIYNVICEDCGRIFDLSYKDIFK